MIPEEAVMFRYFHITIIAKNHSIQLNWLAGCISALGAIWLTTLPDGQAITVHKHTQLRSRTRIDGSVRNATSTTTKVNVDSNSMRIDGQS